MNESINYARKDAREVEPEIVKRWRELGHPSIVVLAKDMGLPYHTCVHRLSQQLKYKVYESRMNYEKDL